MATYSPELKEQILKRMLTPSNQSVAQISRDTGIPKATLYAWKQQFQTQGFVMSTPSNRTPSWDGRAKLAALMHTTAMNDAERSVYCRENGLYPEQLDAWQQAFESLDASKPADKKALAAERKKNRQLEKELLRKDRALAETAALLTLSKKAQAIWGISEED